MASPKTGQTGLVVLFPAKNSHKSKSYPITDSSSFYNGIISGMKD